MKRISSLTLAALLGVAVWYSGPQLRATPQQAFAQAVPASVYSLSYYDVSTAFDKSEGGYGGAGHSGGAGDALLRIVNDGDLGTLAGDICANIYVFNDVQEMQECCQCDVSVDGLRTISVIADLTSNPLITSESTEAGVIKILGVTPASQSAGTSVCFNSAQTLTASNLVSGLHAWINHTESMASNQAGFTPPWGFVTSTSVEEFPFAVLSVGEFESLVSQCAYINLHGSGHGICKCGFGD
jgi:hypothetical protein